MRTKLATRSSVERVAIIDTMLARPEGASVAEMAQRLRCCEKTVRRHVAWMQKKFDLRICLVGWDIGPNRRWVYPLGQTRIFTKEATRRMA